MKDIEKLRVQIEKNELKALNLDAEIKKIEQEKQVILEIIKLQKTQLDLMVAIQL